MDTQPIRGVDHVAIVVEDADAALPYYRDVLGMRLIGDERNLHANVRLVYLDAGNVIVQLVAPFGPGPVQDHLTRAGEGLHHICLRVDDIPQMLIEIGDQHRNTPVEELE